MLSFNLWFICSLKQRRKVCLCGSGKKKKHQYSQKAAIAVELLYHVLIFLISVISHFIFIVNFSFSLWQVYLQPPSQKTKCLLTLISQVLPFLLHAHTWDQSASALSSHLPLLFSPEHPVRCSHMKANNCGGVKYKASHTLPTFSILTEQKENLIPGRWDCFFWGFFLDPCVFEHAPANLHAVAFHARSDMTVDEFGPDSAC